MLNPDELWAVPILFFAGSMFGYAIGFMVSRAIYRRPTWPL